MDDEVRGPDEVLEVGAFYQLLTAHLESAFGRRHPHWVRGEIAKVYEKGHVYVDLVDAGSASSDAKRPVLNAHCWATPWAPLKKKLAAEGRDADRRDSSSTSTATSTSTRPRARSASRSPRSTCRGYSVTWRDAAPNSSRASRPKDLLEANKKVAISPVPLRVGLVASPGTEGYNDFTGQLLHSGYGFEIVLVKSAVQGEAAPAQIVAAIETLDDAGVDIICVVRGGGSKGDLGVV